MQEMDLSTKPGGKIKIKTTVPIKVKYNHAKQRNGKIVLRKGQNVKIKGPKRLKVRYVQKQNVNKASS